MAKGHGNLSNIHVKLRLCVLNGTLRGQVWEKYLMSFWSNTTDQDQISQAIGAGHLWALQTHSRWPKHQLGSCNGRHRQEALEHGTSEWQHSLCTHHFYLIRNITAATLIFSNCLLKAQASAKEKLPPVDAYLQLYSQNRGNSRWQGNVPYFPLRICVPPTPPLPATFRVASWYSNNKKIILITKFYWIPITLPPRL